MYKQHSVFTHALTASYIHAIIMYIHVSYTVFTHVHFVDLDILIRLDVDFATLQRFFNYSILARLEDFVDLDILINLKIL